MPIKAGEIASQDYNICKQLVYSLNVGESSVIDIDERTRCRKYIYEIGLKMNPKREFSTKKITDYSLRVTRII